MCYAMLVCVDVSGWWCSLTSVNSFSLIILITIIGKKALNFVFETKNSVIIALINKISIFI